MKKTFTFLSSMILGSALFAQITITYQVDITPMLDASIPLAPEGIRIGGNFAEIGSTLPDWTPSDAACEMTNIGGNYWSIEVTYPSAAAGETQLFKFVNGDWGSNEGAPALDECGVEDGLGGFNRTFVIPTESTTICFEWDDCTSCAELSTNEASFSSFNVYPNPAKDLVNFSVQAKEAAFVQIHDLSGRVVARATQINGNDIQVNISGLAPGTYVYNVVAGEAVKTGKLNVQ